MENPAGTVIPHAFIASQNFTRLSRRSSLLSFFRGFLGSLALLTVARGKPASSVGVVSLLDHD
jgi:hypothetical protein